MQCKRYDDSGKVDSRGVLILPRGWGRIWTHDGKQLIYCQPCKDAHLHEVHRDLSLDE